MGGRTRPSQTSPHEPLHHVHGWQLHIYLSHHDGGHAVHAANTGALLHQQHLQDGGRLERRRPETGLPAW